jgi:hypothetical protein
MFEFNNAGNAQANQQHCHNQADQEDDEGSEAEFLHLAPKPAVVATLPDGPSISRSYRREGFYGFFHISR